MTYEIVIDGFVSFSRRGTQWAAEMPAADVDVGTMLEETLNKRQKAI
jgi:hypothetical protein